MDWRDLWNPVPILSAVGTLGIVVSRGPRLQFAIAPGCLAGVVVAAASGIGSTHSDLAREVWAVCLSWGLLLVGLNWNPRTAGQSDAAASGMIALPLQLILLAALLVMSSAGDVLTLFMGLQLIAMGTDVLGTLPSRDASVHLGPHEFRSVDRQVSVLLAGLLLLGFVCLVAVTGSTRVETIAEALRTSYVNREAARYAIAGGGSRMLTLSVVFVGIALAGYAAGAPLHAHTTDSVSRCGPQLGPALLLLPRAGALIVWFKLWPGAVIAAESTACVLVTVLAGVTFVLPLLQARAETDLARQWTLLAVAQGGWLLLVVAATAFEPRTPNPDESWNVVEWNLPSKSQAAWLCVLADGVAFWGLFGVLSYLRRAERPRLFLDDLRGLSRSEPIAAGCASLCLLSLSGLPLLGGFWARLFVALTAINVRGEWGPPQILVPNAGLLLLTVVAAISTVWTLSIASRSVSAIWFGMPLGQPRAAGPIASLVTAVLASILLLGCGLLPRPLLTWLCSPVGQ